MNYWENRQKQLNQELERDEKKLKKKLSSFYSAEYRKLEKEIAAYYAIYGEDKVIEYRKLMQNLDDTDRERLIKRMQDFAQLYPDMLPIRESIYKLNRLEGLQMSILMQQLEIGAVDIKVVREHLVRQAVRNANQVAETMGYGKNFYSENSEIIRKIVNAKWCNGKDFSERIWGNVQKLAQYLGTDIAVGFARGDSYSKLVSKLRQRFEKVSRNDAYRLIYTEGTFISNEARAVAFEQDTEEYVFRIQHYKARRSGWSDICDDLHEERFKWSERKPGINFPPMHPWCHCTATPSVTNREKFIEDYEKRHGNGEGEKIANWFSTEKGKYFADIKRIGTNKVDLEYIDSSEYRRKFNKITDNSNVNDALRKYAKAMLTHRKGTDGEDAYIIGSKTGNLLLRKISNENDLEVAITREELNEIRTKKTEGIIGIHNHPTNIYPTGSDFVAAGYRGYQFGVVVTHDGRVFKYNVGNTPFSVLLFDKRIDKYINPPYNLDIDKAHQKVLDEFKEEYGISWKEIK